MDKIQNTVGSIHYSHKQTDYVTPHEHDYYEIIYYIKGKGLSNVYGDDIYNFRYEDDCILLIPPFIKHDEYSANDTEIICNLIKLNENINGVYFYKKNPKNEDVFERIKKKMFHINSIYKQFKEKGTNESEIKDIEFAIDNLRIDVYRLLGENKLRRSGYLKDVVGAVKNYIKKYFTQKINYDALADEYGYSYERFRHLFADYTGMSLYAYQQGLRLNYAKQLITVTNLSIEEIGKKVGIQSDTRFSIWFKELVGTTPLKYRKMNQKLKWGTVWNLTDVVKTNKSPNVIIDTDLGCDCDDAAAIAIANVLHREKVANVLAITHCINDELGARCIDFINGYYGNDFEVGMSDCCNFDGTKYLERYVYKLKSEFDKSKRIDDSVALIKKKLVSAKEKSVKLVFIGQLNNLAKLLSDEESKLLVYKKVESIVIMAGNFEEYDEYFEYKSSKFKAEFNVEIDIPAARKVVEEIGLPLIFMDFNQGIKVLTGEVLCGFDKNPISRIYNMFGVVNRESWDLLTVMYAILGGGGMFAESNKGTVTIDESGKTTFREGEGNHQILTLVKPKDATEQINNILLKVREVK